MKKFLSILLALILACSLAFAEAPQQTELTSDELAYYIYLDIAYVYENSVLYLGELGRAWDIALDAKDVAAVNNLCYMDCFPEEQLASIYNLLLGKYHYTADDLRRISFSTDIFSVSDKTDIIWLILDLEIESHYIVAPSSMEKYLDRAMRNIRLLIASDKDHPYLSTLQDYYKDASFLLEYTADFQDTYAGFSTNLNTYKQSKRSWDIDFEFLFDPADYENVVAFRTAAEEKDAQVTYDRALSLENDGRYEEAIAQYWLCYGTLPVLERIESCHAAMQEQKYQSALGLESSGKFEEARSIYISLGDYKDSSDRISACTYGMALSLETQGEYTDALELYKTIPSYSDVQERMKLCTVRSIYNFGPYNDGYAVVQLEKGKYYGVINEDLELLFTTESTIYDFNEGYAVTQIVTDNGSTVRRGVIDTSGNYVLGPSSSLSNISNIVSCGMIANRGVYINVETGNTVTLPTNEYLTTPFSEGLRRTADTSGKSGYIDTTGKFVIPAQYTFSSSFVNGYAIVSKDSGDNRRYFVIDTEGNTVLDIPKDYGRTATYTGLDGFYDGLCMVAKNGKCGYMDIEGNLVIDFLYDSAEPFSNGMARVTKDGKFGYINTSGELTIPCEYDAIEGSAFTPQGLVLVKQGSDYSVLRSDGTVVIQPGYTKIVLSDSPYIFAYKNNVWYVLSSEGDLLY